MVLNYPNSSLSILHPEANASVLVNSGSSDQLAVVGDSCVPDKGGVSGSCTENVTLEVSSFSFDNYVWLNLLTFLLGF